jgi:hypothetical protein
MVTNDSKWFNEYRDEQALSDTAQIGLHVPDIGSGILCGLSALSHDFVNQSGLSRVAASSR